MMLERCRICGNMPEVLYRVGYTYGTMKEARAQIKCIACGNAGRPVWGDPDGEHKEPLIEMAAGYWNQDQRQFKNKEDK